MTFDEWWERYCEFRPSDRVTYAAREAWNAGQAFFDCREVIKKEREHIEEQPAVASAKGASLMNRRDIKLAIDRCVAHDVPDAADLIETLASQIDTKAYRIMELKQQLADLKADRDSWEDQADERVKDCETFINELEQLRKQLVGKNDRLRQAAFVIRSYQTHENQYAEYLLNRQGVRGMNKEWIKLNDIQSVAMAQANGWEIEALASDCGWYPWIGASWAMNTGYRGRPRQPKKATVTSECWRDKISGTLHWQKYGHSVKPDWQRFPAGDITGEVEE